MASNLESFVCEAADAVKFKLGKSKLSKPSKKINNHYGFCSTVRDSSDVSDTEKVFKPDMVSFDRTVF